MPLTPQYVVSPRPGAGNPWLGFQLVAVKVDPFGSVYGEENPASVREVEVQPFPPIAIQNIEYTFTNRHQVDQSNGHYVYSANDEGIGEVTISGTFGGSGHYERHGLAYVDGYTALIAFIDRMFRASVKTNSTALKAAVKEIDPGLADEGSNYEIKPGEVLIVNMYDFDLKRFKAVAFKRLTVTRNPEQGRAEKFNLSLEVMGDAIRPAGDSENGWLVNMFEVKRLLDSAYASIDEMIGKVLENDVMRAVSDAVDLASISLSTLQTVKTTIPTVTTTFSGAAFTSVGSEIPGSVGRFFSNADRLRSQTTQAVTRPFVRL